MALRFHKNIMMFMVMLAVFSAHDAFAATSTIGVILSDTRNSISGFTRLQNMIAYCAGVLFAVLAIFKFKDHVDNPAQTPISAGMKRFIAGGMFLCFPFLAAVVQGSIYKGAAADDMAKGSSALDVAGIAALDPNGLDTMVVKFMADIALPFEFLLSCFVYLFAGALLLVGINRLTKRMDDGPRGPAGLGTLMTFIVSGVLFSWGDIMGSITNSIFNPTVSGLSHNKSNVDPNGLLGLNKDQAFQVNQVIQAVMLFVALVGMIAFVRGWLVLRAFADGQQGATLAQGLTFLVGGALAINLGDLVNALQATLGVQGITFS